jgi:hypothetical protein
MLLHPCNSLALRVDSVIVLPRFFNAVLTLFYGNQLVPVSFNYELRIIQ